MIGDIFKFNLDNKHMNLLNKYTVILLCIFLMLPNAIYGFFRIYDNNSYDIINLLFLIPLSYIFIYNLIKHKVKGIDVIIFAILLVIVLISSIFSYNPYVAILGSSRKDGFITLLIYYITYCNSKSLDKKSIKDIINVFLVIGFINFLYGILQSYLPRNIISTKDFGHMANGFMGNPNFYGTFMLMASLLALGLYLYKDEKIYLYSFLTSYVGIILSSSTGPFITLVIGIIMLFIYFNKKYNLYKYLKIVLLLIGLYFFVNWSNIWINQTFYKADINSSYTITGNLKDFKSGISNNNLFDKLDGISSGRITLWKNTIQYIDDNNKLLLGTGPDNFNIYSAMIDGNKLVGFYHDDKAHNIYLNMVVETGIFSLIIYIIWIFIYHKRIIKTKNTFLHILLFVLIGYNIQGMFNINVIYVMIYYYIFIGIGLGDLNETRIN